MRRIPRLQDGRERRCTNALTLLGPHVCSAGPEAAATANFQTLAQAEAVVPPEARALPSQGRPTESPRASDAPAGFAAGGGHGARAGGDSNGEDRLKAGLNGVDVAMDGSSAGGRTSAPTRAIAVAVLPDPGAPTTTPDASAGRSMTAR